MKTVLVYSGGMDSTTLLYTLLADARSTAGIKRKDEVVAISFNYGQRHDKELKCAAKICKKLGVPHVVIDVRSINKLMSGSSLTSKTIKVPHGHYEDQNMRSTVVPNRNMVFISLATAYAVSLKFDCIALAVHSGDHAIYPDCRPEFIKKVDAVTRIANYESIKVLAPFMNKSKTQIARIGRRLGVPFEETWTCYEGGARPCGKCGSCVERAEALSF